MNALLEKTDKANWNVLVQCAKWDTDEAFAAGEAPYEVITKHGNLLLNAGITRLLNLLCGAGGTAYNNANSRIGVGDSSTAAAAAQTDLQAATNKYYMTQDATYPQVSAQTATWRATFGSGVANFAWAEWGIDNGTTANTTPVSPMLNRKVEALGTKSGGSWQLTVSITVS